MSVYVLQRSSGEGGIAGGNYSNCAVITVAAILRHSRPNIHDEVGSKVVVSVVMVVSVVFF